MEQKVDLVTETTLYISLQNAQKKPFISSGQDDTHSPKWKQAVPFWGEVRNDWEL
jgi:hypothetical protein